MKQSVIVMVEQMTMGRWMDRDDIGQIIISGIIIFLGWIFRIRIILNGDLANGHIRNRGKIGYFI